MNSFRRNEILLAINELAASETGETAGPDKLLEKCCKILMQNQEYCLIWAGKRDDDGTAITPLTALTSANIPDRDCMYLVEQVITDMNEANPAAKALISGSRVIIQDIRATEDSEALRQISLKTGFRSCSCWPLKYKGEEFGVINIHSEKVGCFNPEEISFLQTVIADIALALYTQDMTRRIQVERDFNKEMVDTMEALLISISPCGRILSFNQKAEQVTGYKEKEVIDHYWVDVLMAEDHRKANQQLLSNVLKGKKGQMNFESCLLTKDKQNRFISWHASFRQNLDQGKLGLVLFGIDITGQLQVDHDLKQAISQWENIFSAIQDPALIVSSDSVILDANPATFTAARKTRAEVIGHKICDILHLGRATGAPCPLEQFVQLGQSRIIETELRGFHGNYLLTVSPLHMADGSREAALLVARDLTEEELMKAEAMRSAQLASVGELAAGVAHEINNPINGIINYAQIILDSPEDPDNQDLLTRIKKEGKRIASIVSNLLDFSRRHEESPEEVEMQSIMNKCLELVSHRFKDDMILIDLQLPSDLPQVYCNSQQIQQVLLNILSNARYALNERFPGHNPEKKLTITGETVLHSNNTFVRIIITDNGSGIEQDLIERVFDPFYSSKPKGEGTGLGLSISHGLIQDNKGYLRIISELGSSTSLLVDLPVSANSGVL
jgi:PAS domain S-box-containing protein